jgi:hypothetical protein
MITFITYDKWMKTHSNNANIPFALGEAYENEESPRAKTYLLKAVDINSKFTEVWGVSNVNLICVKSNQLKDWKGVLLRWRYPFTKRYGTAGCTLMKILTFFNF